MSVLGISRFVACFVDDKGDYVGKKVFGHSWCSLGMKKQFFDYDGGMYIINPANSSRITLSFKSRLFFDDYIYVYQLGNPSPISFLNGGFVPMMRASDFKERLESKLVRDLNYIASGGLQIPWKWLLVIIVGVGIVYYLITQTNIFGGQESQVINNVTAVSSRGGG